jgi:PAS domain S-box-containing protein/putative nucleotidyltransferase with HDIG domain
MIHVKSLFSSGTQFLDRQVEVDPARQRMIVLNTMLLTAMLAIFSLTLINAFGFLAAPSLSDSFYLLEDLIGLLVIIGLAELNRRGHTYRVALIFFILVIISATFLFPSEEIDRVFVVYAIPIVAASFLMHPHASILFTLVAMVNYGIVRWQLGTLDQFDYIGALTLIVIASVASLLTSLLNHSITRLSESQERFRAFFDQSSEGIMLIDEHGTIFEWNRAQEKITGIPTARAVGMPIWDVQFEIFDSKHRTPLTHTRLKTAMLEMLATGYLPQSNQSIEFTIQTNAGERRTILHSTFPIQTQHGFHLGAISRDISEKKIAEETIRASEESFRIVFQNAGEGIGRVDGPGNFIIANPTLEEMFGVTSGGLIGRNITEFIPLDQRKQHTNQIEQRRSGVRGSYDLTIERPSGERRDIIVTATPWFDGAGNYAGAFGVFRDITERKRADQELATRAERLDALYGLSRNLANTDALEIILDDLVKCAVETTHVTFARLALAQNKHLVIRAAYPVRSLEIDLGIGQREPFEAFNFFQVLENNAPIVLQADDPQFDSAERRRLFLGLVQTMCLVPLRFGNETIGMLILGEARHRTREPFDDAKLQLARSIGDQATSAIHRAMLRAQTERRLEHLQSLRVVDMAITSSVNVDLTLNVLLTQARSQLGAQAAAILLLNSTTNVLTFRNGQGFQSHAIEQTRLRLGQDFAGRVALERRFIAISDLLNNPTPQVKAFADLLGNLRAYYAAPLVSKGQVKGVIEVFNPTPIDLDSDWINLLETFASQAAIAIDNAELFDGLQRSNLELAAAYDATIEGWSRALDLRDHDTEDHSRRVAEMTVQLARAMNIPDSELSVIRRGALLHDIGKMGVPDAILLKPDKLTEDEWGIMRCHPQFAYDMLSPIAYLHNAIDIPYCHHEKWDGTGYPRGLQGETIPLAARLFAVVDVWDALLSNRPYRDKLDEYRVLEEIRSLSGTAFDPRVVSAFLQMLA